MLFRSEIEAARLQPGEEETLAAEHARAMHATRLLELSRSILGALVEDDDSIAQRLSLVGRSLQEMARLDSSAKEAVQLHQQAEGSLHDLRRRVERQATAMDIDPERLAVVSERLDLLQSLRRKYGNSIPDILQFASRAATELAAIEGRHEKAASLRGEQAAIEEELADLGSRLRTARHAAAPRLASAVGRELAGLGFARPELQVSLRPAPGHDAPASAAPSGLDACEFLFVPNPGEPPLPLRSIASSGELARVMLALKTVLAAEDEVPVLVFDEVDANVGGETAHAVGEKLRRIAQDHQVLCISHLAQVAAHADAHYVVTKEIREGRTESQVRRLDDAGRIAELGRMLGGGPAAQRHAAEILNSARSKRP